MRCDRHFGQRSLLVAVVCTFVLGAAAAPARAELAFFANGRTLSVKSHRMEGDTLVLTMRSGGEMTLDPSIIVRFAPDEVPYPEPPAAAPAPIAPPADAVPYGEIIDKVAREQGV